VANSKEVLKVTKVYVKGWSKGALVATLLGMAIQSNLISVKFSFNSKTTTVTKYLEFG